jgi:hypothetical protein
MVPFIAIITRSEGGVGVAELRRGSRGRSVELLAMTVVALSRCKEREGMRPGGLGPLSQGGKSI